EQRDGHVQDPGGVSNTWWSDWICWEPKSVPVTSMFVLLRSSLYRDCSIAFINNCEICEMFYGFWIPHLRLRHRFSSSFQGFQSVLSYLIWLLAKTTRSVEDVISTGSGNEDGVV